MNYKNYHSGAYFFLQELHLSLIYKTIFQLEEYIETFMKNQQMALGYRKSLNEKDRSYMQSDLDLLLN